MKQVFKTTDIAIITSSIVDKTFDNTDALLHSVIEIVGDDISKQIRTYKVRTDLVGYVTSNMQLFNDDGTPSLDADGNAIFETKDQLTWLEQKLDWSLQTITYAQIDGFVIDIASQIPEGLTRTQKDNTELQIMFLSLRQQSAPWGIAADKWRLRTNDDLLKNK
jgi:hypothetical protein